jgi:hypothetical protein
MYVCDALMCKDKGKLFKTTNVTKHLCSLYSENVDKSVAAHAVRRKDAACGGEVGQQKIPVIKPGLY